MMTNKQAQGSGPIKFRYKDKDVSMLGFSESDHIFKCISESNNFYELPLLKYIRNISKFCTNKHSFIIDVGANIGNHSVFFGNIMQRFTVAVEPNQKVLPILRANLVANCEEFELFECGLGKTSAIGKMIEPTNDNNIGQAKVETEIDHQSEASIEIRTLDALVLDLQSRHGDDFVPTIIKIDVEGMQLDVVKGAGICLEKYHPELFIEVETEREFEQLSRHLDKFGYRALIRWGATPVWHFTHVESTWMLVWKTLSFKLAAYSERRIKKFKAAIRSVLIRS